MSDAAPVVPAKPSRFTPRADGSKPAGGRPKGSFRSKHMTVAKWAEAEALWALGDISLDDLSKRMGCRPETLSRRFTRKGIAKGSRAAELSAKVKAAVEETLVDDATILAGRIKATKDQHYQMAENLAKLTWAEVLTAKKNGTPLGVILPNLKSLQTAINTLKQAREERFAVLGLDRPDALDTNELPELVISELTPEQVDALRNAKNDDDEIETLPEEMANVEPPEDEPE